MSRDSSPRRVADLISESVLVINDGYRAKNEELASAGLPFARAGNIDGGFQFADADYFPEQNLGRVGNKISQPGDVVFTSKGTVGRFAYVRDSTPRFVYSPQLCFWRALDRRRLHSRWLFYWMQSGEFQEQCDGVKGQTDMADYVSLRDQRAMSISLPPIKEQSAIGLMLGALDDKIELTRRMNQTLEFIARAIFRSWFVDFDPVVAKAEGRQPFGMSAEVAALFPDRFSNSDLGPIPNGCAVVELDRIADIIDCLHTRKPERTKDGKPLLQLCNILDNGLVDMSDAYLVSDPDYRLWTSRVEARQGDCVITNVGRVGAVAQMPVGLQAALGRNMTAVRCKPEWPFSTYLIECLLGPTVRDEIALRTDAGTILDSLNVRNIPRLRTVVAPAEVLAAYEKTARPLRALMESNLDHSRMLAGLRDTLLPKLMSGELRVREAEKLVGAHV
jgi:type I restriction enzyme S subunit